MTMPEACPERSREDIATLTDQQLHRLLSERAGPIVAELGRRYIASLPRSDRPCEACGEIMPGVTDRRRVCSESCRGRLHYWVKRAQTDPGAVHRLRLEARGFLPDSRAAARANRRRRYADLATWKDAARVPTLPPPGGPADAGTPGTERRARQRGARR